MYFEALEKDQHREVGMIQWPSWFIFYLGKCQKWEYNGKKDNLMLHYLFNDKL
jgi:hypothetical protein